MYTSPLTNTQDVTFNFDKQLLTDSCLPINSFGLTDTIWQHRSGLNLYTEMACCLMATCHKLTNVELSSNMFCGNPMSNFPERNHDIKYRVFTLCWIRVSIMLSRNARFLNPIVISFQLLASLSFDGHVFITQWHFVTLHIFIFVAAKFPISLGKFANCYLL